MAARGRTVQLSVTADPGRLGRVAAQERLEKTWRSPAREGHLPRLNSEPSPCYRRADRARPRRSGAVEPTARLCPFLGRDRVKHGDEQLLHYRRNFRSSCATLSIPCRRKISSTETRSLSTFWIPCSSMILLNTCFMAVTAARMAWLP